MHSEGGDQEAPCHMIQPIGTSMTQQTEAANGRPVTRRTISNQGILDKGALGYIRKRLLSRFCFFPICTLLCISPINSTESIQGFIP